MRHIRQGASKCKDEQLLSQIGFSIPLFSQIYDATESPPFVCPNSELTRVSLSTRATFVGSQKGGDAMTWPLAIDLLATTVSQVYRSKLITLRRTQPLDGVMMGWLIGESEKTEPASSSASRCCRADIACNVFPFTSSAADAS